MKGRQLRKSGWWNLFLTEKTLKMIISNRHKFIFISVPKTGSQAIRDFFLSIDDSAKWNSFSLEGKGIKCNEHITAYDLRRKIGALGNDYKIIAFVRSPYARAVSSYFFYKNGKALHEKQSSRIFITKLNIILAKLLPFQIWSLLKPMKSNYEYVTDLNGKIIVDFIGQTEHLNSDLLSICNSLSIPINNFLPLPIKNKSNHRDIEKYFNNYLHKLLFDMKISKELLFYQKLKLFLTTQGRKAKGVTLD
jgi:hypothetical protein